MFWKIFEKNIKQILNTQKKLEEHDIIAKTSSQSKSYNDIFVEKYREAEPSFMLDEKKSFLLHYLHHRKIEWEIDKSVQALFDDYKRVISDLRKYGYLMDDNHSFFLEEMNVTDLKTISKSLSLPAFGKKIDLIERIVNNTTPEERAAICPDLYYVLTPSGLKVDEEYTKNKRTQNILLKDNMFKDIQSKMYEQTALTKSNAYSKEVIAPGIGIDWSDTEAMKKHAQLEQQLLREYDFSDLDNSDDYKEILFQILYYDNEIEHNLLASIEKFITTCEEKINCPDLEIFFQNKGFFPSESKKIFVYLDTKRFNIFQQNMRRILKNEKYFPLPKGEFHVSDKTINF